jgi:hypothetical protein
MDLVSHYRNAGFTDAEISEHINAMRERYRAAGFGDDEIDAHLGMPPTPKNIPQAFLDRVSPHNEFFKAAADFFQQDAIKPSFKGAPAISFRPPEMLETRPTPGVTTARPEPPPSEGFIEAVARGARQGFGEEGLGITEKTPGITKVPTWALSTAQTIAAPADFIMRAPFALIGGGAAALKQLFVQAGGDEAWANRMERDLNMLGQSAVAEAGRAPHVGALNKLARDGQQFTRVGVGPTGEIEPQKIGGLPKGADFSEAGRALAAGDTTPLMEQKLGVIYGETGVHPAEVVHDAQRDPTITQSILSSDKGDLPEVYGKTVSLDKEAGEKQGMNYYTVRDAKGEPIAYASVEIQGTEARIENIYKDINPALADVDERADIAKEQMNKLGPSVIRELLRQFREQNPEVTTITGERVSGARVGGEYDPDLGKDISLSLKREDILTERLPTSGGAAARPMPIYSDAEKQILSKISIDEKSPERAMTWDRLYTNFIEKLFPISKAVKEAGLADLKTEDNPYVLARLLSGHAGKADHFLNNGTFDFTTYENNGKSLKAILSPVADDLNGFRAYATSARAIELESRGVKSGFDFGPSAPPLVSEGLDAARTVVAEGREKYEKPFRELIDYQNRVSKYLRDSGVLSEAGYKAMLEANKMYVPFSRVMGFDELAPHRGGSSLQAHNPIRAIKGSARDIVDPIESVVRNTYHMIEMAEKNVVGTKLVDMLRRASEELPGEKPAAETLATADLPRTKAMAEALGEVGVKKPDDLASALAHATEPRREGEIAILRDGKRETYKVDPDLARAMKGLDAQSVGLLEKVLAFPASTLRAGAVLTPDFALRHTIRDFMYAATTFKGGVFTPIDMAKGFLGLITKDADYWNWLKGGGGNISVAAMDRQYLQEDLRKLTGQTGLVGRAWNVLTDPEASMWEKTASVGKLPFQAISKFVLDPLRVATQFAENASHLAAFKKGMRASERVEPEPGDLRSKIIQAAWQSRDTAVDAARMGANMRAYNQITAFANIKLQDLDRVVRAILNDPIPTLAKIGGAITVPSVLLWAANHQDPRYDEIPQWQKDMFWIVMTPDHIFRLPKPWGMGMIFGSLPERLLDSYYRGKPEAFKKFFEDLYATSGPDFVPTAAAPIIDQFANRSTFTNRTLIPSDMEKLLPEYQYTPYTTETTKKLGQVIGAFPGMTQLKMEHSGWGGTARALTSPILIENYIRGWTGTLGMYALETADKGLRMAGVLPDPPLPTRTLADIPVIKAFVVRYPSASTESIQNFYDEYEKNKSYFDTWQAKAKDGDVAAMEHIVDMGGDMMFAKLDGIKKVLTEHSHLIRDIYKNPAMPPDEKRQLVDTLYSNMIEVGRYGMEAVRQMRMESDLKRHDRASRPPLELSMPTP